MLAPSKPRPPVFGLAALFLAFVTGPAVAQKPSLNDRLQVCAACHGEDGNSTREKIPSLAGQPEFFILNQLILMREGVRRVEQMEGLTKDLTDEDVVAIASHYAKLAPRPSGEKVDPALVARGQELAVRLRCASCHLPTLAGQDQMPRLARQRIDYMVDAMKAFRDDKRSGADTAMTAVIVGVSDADLTALAHYAASK